MSDSPYRGTAIGALRWVGGWRATVGNDSDAIALSADEAPLDPGSGRIFVQAAQGRGAADRAGRSEGSWRTMLANSATLQVSKSGSRRGFMQGQEEEIRPLQSMQPAVASGIAAHFL